MESLIKSIKSLFLLSCFLLSLLPSHGVSQGLLPDGGFEILIDGDCERPDQGFKRTQYWYLLDATPDLFEGGCAFDETDFVFWDAENQPYEGRNYAGIWSRWNSNDTYFTEGIASSLTAPLEAGKSYLFEMAIKNQGTFQGLDGSIVGCELNPEKHIDIYLSSDSIKVVNNFSNGTASTSASLVASMNSLDITGGMSEEWTIVSTCFEAEGGEEFFALIMPLGTFGELPECALTMATSGVFRSFYYNIDALSITDLPTSLESEIAICENRPTNINLIDLFQFELLESAQFIWEDSFVGGQREISKSGMYLITAEIGCAQIPLQLEINGQNCETRHYLPNIFSPNGDNKNDLLLPQFNMLAEVSSYSFSVHDRWGTLIFSSSDPNKGWNGRINSREAETGVYTWVLFYETPELDKILQVNESGGVLLIR